MKPVLIDSDILIEVTRGKDAAILEIWNRLAGTDATLLVSPVTIAELWHGARPKEHAVLEALFAALGCVPVSAAIGRLAGSFLHAHARSHAVELGDALIAASAVTQEARLWTRNRKHYPMRGVEFF